MQASPCLPPIRWGVGHFTRDRKASGSERVILQAYRRRYEDYPEADTAALKLVILQRRPAGWTEVLPASFDDDGFAIKDYPEPVSETGFAISCPARGLVRMVPPTLWMEQVSVAFGLVDAVLDVEVPSGGRRKPASRYKTGRVKEAGGVHVGEALPLSGAIRVVELQEARKDRLQTQSAPQRLFGVHDADKDDLTGDDLVQLRGEAEGYVANLVAGAQRRVTFVDPDFGMRELQNYALRVMRDGVEVTILTGAPHMRKARPNDNAEELSPEEQTASSVPPGVLLLAQLRHVQGRLGPGAPKVLVMPSSRKPVFHDRFLVIDDVVWASGPSFNELGERIGLISRVHEPRIVIAAIDRVLDRSKPLAEWIAEAGLPELDRVGPDATQV
ncbi:MAG TPA: VPA1262 family N-terminal domain-containing protein [Stellaceae bacterium]|nr:VPA1262 family N-terminal domain-containing protein [Stellaceae bacterium]